MKYYLVLATVLAVCSWVASDSNYYKIATALGQQCKLRVGATDSDFEMFATHQPIETEVLKKLVYCAYQKIDVICGDLLAGIAYLSWAYMRVYDGEAAKFNNATAKIQKCWNAGKKFDGVDGIKAIYELHNCCRIQWIQDTKSAESEE